MALKRKKPAAKEPLPDARVRSVKFVLPRVLATLPPDHPLWRAKSIAAATKQLAGAIVRAQPPADATDEQVAAVVGALRAAGATVRLDPRQRAGATVPAAAHRAPAPETHRQAVLELVAQAHTEDRAALAALCEDIMTEVDL